MKIVCLLSITLTLLLSGGTLANETEEERAASQAKLDAACEVARQKKLVPVRAQLVAECVVNEEQPDRKSCERSYANYGERVGKRPPLFYDLPQCVTAHEYRTSYRSADD